MTAKIMVFNSHLLNLGYKNHAIHTDPLIRRESVYPDVITMTSKVSKTLADVLLKKGSF